VIAGAEWRSIKEMLTMTLHDRDSIRDQSEDCVFAARDMNRPIPKYRFPREETPSREVYQLVADELMMDGNARQNLATFCQTWEEPEVLGLMALAINKNMIDRDEYPQTAEIERRCVHMMADLWNAPDAANTVGTSAIGSSEACMLAGMAAKWRWRARRRAAGKPTDNPNFVCGPVQVVWHKFARYWDVEIREVPMAPGRYMMDPESMLERVDENTIMVVPTLGVTYTGAYEPVEAISQALDKLQADTGLDVDIHVDGASGGFLAPFCAPEVAFDFRLPRVKSISASGHKFGLAPLGAGWVVFRDVAELPDDLIFHVNYLGGDMPVFQINFSRPAGQIIASYYNFLRLGHEGYRKIHMASYEIGQYLASEIVKLGPFELLCDSNPATAIPTVTWRIREGEKPPYTLFDLADRLRNHGWQVPAYTLTGSVSDIAVQRVLVRLGISRDMASMLLDDFRDAVAHFDRHPVTAPMSKEESGGFSHL
jgi:glutamate decarboxylase